MWSIGVRVLGHCVSATLATHHLFCQGVPRDVMAVAPVKDNVAKLNKFTL